MSQTDKINIADLEGGNPEAWKSSVAMAARDGAISAAMFVHTVQEARAAIPYNLGVTAASDMQAGYAAGQKPTGLQIGA